MDDESKIWATTRTGTIIHAFNEDGTALCRTNIRHTVGELRSRDAVALEKRRSFGLTTCENCEARFAHNIRQSEWEAERFEAAHAEALEINATAPVQVLTEDLRPGNRVWHPYDMECFTVKEVPQELKVHLGFHSVGANVTESGMRVTGTSDSGETVHVDAAQSYRWTLAEIQENNTPEPRVWAVATKGWDLHIVRHGKALCERPVSSVRLTDRESDSKLVANKLTRKCFGCTEIYNQRENTMPTLDKRVTTGPLTPRQKYILSRVAQGHQHAEIGEELSLSRTAVAEDMRVVVAKLKVKNSAEAVMVYGRHIAYKGAARLLQEGLIANPNGDVEEHINHVLEDLAQELRTRAYQTIPE